ncbi:MAG: type II toxin-antitoxin system CcdA family antitoxin [Gammaproteobacteria bacterium]|nr:type II toxin-antitoxin system CcdA family antitoxin [Gammaproteobacteria bacterium]
MTEHALGYTPAPKKSVNLSVNSELVQKAKGLGINLSALLEVALVQAIREKERQNWIAENADAIDDYNKRTADQGVFSDGKRKF